MEYRDVVRIVQLLNHSRTLPRNVKGRNVCKPVCQAHRYLAAPTYLVRVIEIGRYFSWLLLCDRACPVQQPAFFLSRVLLLGFGKLLSIKKKCHCRFVVMCVGFTTNCQNMSRSKSLPPDIHPLLFLHATTHTLALAGTCTSLGFSQ